MADERPTPNPVYANVVDFTLGPWDLVMDLGFKNPEQARRGAPEYEVVARVAMSLGHAKSMLPILAKLIADYEQANGQIPAPGFQDFSKE